MNERAYAAHESGIAAHLLIDEPLADVVEVGGADGHHLARVRRLRVGERVTVGDGVGAWRAYTIERVRDATLWLGAESELRLEPDVRDAVTIAPALSKGTKLETVVQHLTEVGVDAVVPWVAQRSVQRLDGRARQRLHERLGVVARSATMQSRRSRLPRVAPIAEGVAGVIAVLPADAVVVAADVIGDVAALADGRRRRAEAGSTFIVTGPEGGFDPTERAALTTAGAALWSLGPTVLRTETAPLAAAILARS